jgi:hypothetical protein
VGREEIVKNDFNILAEPLHTLSSYSCTGFHVAKPEATMATPASV